MNMIKEAPNSAAVREVSFDLSHPLPAERLLTDQAQVKIAFKGQIYTLRQTRNDKLILTK
ncbi:MAG: hemin uptake protein HemP [Thiobacillaceae bacterium]